MANGKPDFSGVWNPPGGYLRNLAKDLKEEVPFQPWAKAIYDERAAGLHWREEPDANCLPQGTPKILVAPEQLEHERLGPQEGFVLSRINGESDIESILSVCPFREADSLPMIKKLLDSGIIGIK